MELREWLSILVIIAIVLILLDGFRRKMIERKNRVRIKLDKNIPPENDESDHSFELPAGGARTLRRGEGDFFDDDPSEELNLDEKVPVLMDSVDVPPADIVKAEAEFSEADWESDDFEDEDTGEDEKADELEDDSDDEMEDELEDDFDDEIEDELENDFDDESEDDSLYNHSAPVADSRNRIEPSFGDNDILNASPDTDVEPDVELDSDDDSMIAARPVATKESQGELSLDNKVPDDDAAEFDNQGPAEVIVINVMAGADKVFSGSDLMPLLLSHGMRLGDMSIFHRHADNNGNGPAIFSMANIVKPGTFDMGQIEEFETPGVSFFLQLPSPVDNMESFEKMLNVANVIKESLQGELKDENRNSITRQTVDHCRERIRDFELGQLSKQ